ncbi:uncharacterized protein BXZ73DRAFT_40879 [Epithele typhae]|uniref:uncharacterized protein n=1 Tax=Epithele typhae TaxID=378194 RepID=UPI0020077897|nr:uncharacterized protein BXZ73DRAFT_40879 [Epithele typhae]KAH9942414.1 hypothetical protein BXZ73DRAFT_40879 [Epithele typhae]
MDNIVAIGLGLGLRALIDIVTQHNHRVDGSLVGLWEGAVLRHFITKYPSTIDPYAAYAFRLLVDFLWTNSYVRLFIVLLWTFMGMLLTDVGIDMAADRRFQRLMRSVRHAVIYPLLSQVSSSSPSPRRSSSSSASAAPSRAQYYQVPPTTISTASTLRSPDGTARSPPLTQRTPSATEASVPLLPRRPALRVPGAFAGSETDTSADRPSTPSRSAPTAKNPTSKPSQPTRTSQPPKSSKPPPPPSPSINRVLSDDERSVGSRGSGLTTPVTSDTERPADGVYSPEPVKSGLTTPAHSPPPRRGHALPPVRVIDEVLRTHTPSVASRDPSDTAPVPIPIRFQDSDDSAQVRAALARPELIPDMQTPQPSPGINAPNQFIADDKKGKRRSGARASTTDAAAANRASGSRLSTEPPPAYERTPGDGEVQPPEEPDDDTPGASVLSGDGDRQRLLQRAESLRTDADVADKRRAQLRKELETAKRSQDHWAAFRLKHEMARAEKETKELHAKAARRFYRAHNLKPEPQTIDVHRLKVAEAIEKVEQALYDAMVTKTPELRIITGRGNHSKNSIPAIKLAVIGAMADYRIDIITDPNNSGVLIVHPPQTADLGAGPSR